MPLRIGAVLPGCCCTTASSFSSTLALRYAFSKGQLNDFAVDPDDPQDFTTRGGALLVRERGLYVGGGLSF